jgi:hypothetical protein
VTDPATGLLQPILLDLASLTADAPVKLPPHGDDESLRNLGYIGGREWLSYHTPTKIADKLIELERSFSLDDTAVQERTAQDCADGALIGPGQQQTLT